MSNHFKSISSRKIAIGGKSKFIMKRIIQYCSIPETSIKESRYTIPMKHVSIYSNFLMFKSYNIGSLKNISHRY